MTTPLYMRFGRLGWGENKYGTPETVTFVTFVTFAGFSKDIREIQGDNQATKVTNSNPSVRFRRSDSSLSSLSPGCHPEFRECP